MGWRRLLECIMSQTTDRPPCPVCGKPLTVAYEMDRKQFVVWCARGPCPSNAANDGAYGDTVKEAAKQLAVNVDEEGLEPPTEHNEDDWRKDR